LGSAMTESPNVYVASIDKLVDVFREGLLALIPVAERAQVPWREPDAYDDWDELAESLYGVFVEHPTRLPESALEPWPLASYDYHVDSYAEFSWIEVTGPDVPASHAFVGFRTSSEPFDTLCLVQVDPESGASGQNIDVPWRDHGFVLRRRFVDSAAEVVTEIRVDW
jgi:hypothetical protein